MVRSGAHDAAVRIIADVPRHEDERHAPVGELLAQRRTRALQLEDGFVEARDVVVLQRADRKVADAPRLVSWFLHVDGLTVLHVDLRDVEDVAGGIVCTDAGEGTRAGTLHDMDVAVVLQHLAYRVRVVDLEPEMIEARGTPGLARIDVEADVAVAHGDRALGTRVLGHAHAEDGLVEASLERVLVAHDGDVANAGGGDGGLLQRLRWNVSPTTSLAFR